MNSSASLNMSSENVTFARHNSHLKLKVMKNMSSFTFTNKVNDALLFQNWGRDFWRHFTSKRALKRSRNAKQAQIDLKVEKKQQAAVWKWWSDFVSKTRENRWELWKHIWVMSWPRAWSNVFVTQCWILNISFFSQHSSSDQLGALAATKRGRGARRSL